MNRADYRRSKREREKDGVTYTFTREQLDSYIRERAREEIERIKKEATDNAVDTMMILTLALPLEVLKEHYWTENYKTELPAFAEYLLGYFEDWQNGKLDIQDLIEDVWRYAGIKFELEDQENG